MNDSIKHIIGQILLLIIGIILGITLFMHNSGGKQESTTTIIHNYYDSSKKAIAAPIIIKSDPIFQPVPPIVDTNLILKLYFAKNPIHREWKDSSIRASLDDTISQNGILKSKFEYQWLKPIKSVESTTVTIKESKPFFSRFFIGLTVNTYTNGYPSGGPDIYYVAPNQTLYGIGSDIKNRSISVKAAFSLYDIIRNKNKRKQ